jgi:FkbM family methyltransferase
LHVKKHYTSTGTWFLPEVPQDVVIAHMRAGKIYDQEIVDEAARWIRPGSTVLDVGSFVGQMAVLFSRMVGSAGHVHAFEAEPFICDLLRRNLDVNHCANVSVHEGAVWHESGATLAYPPLDPNAMISLASYGIDPSADTRNIHSVRIDDLSIEAPVSFMKVDVQGSDLFAILGAQQTIGRNKMPIIFEYEQSLQGTFGTSFDDYVSAVHALGYRFEKVIGANNYLVVPRGAADRKRDPLRWHP